MTHDTAHLQVTVEGDEYDILEWEEAIHEINDDVDVTVTDVTVE